MWEANEMKGLKGLQALDVENYPDDDTLVSYIYFHKSKAHQRSQSRRITGKNFILALI